MPTPLLMVVLLELVGRSLLQTSMVSEPRAPLVRLPPSPAGHSMVPEGHYLVLMADWGHHTSIVVQQPPGWRLGPPEAEAAPFVEAAWGDRRYFHGQERSPEALVAALFLPTESVLYIAGHADPSRLAGTVAVWERRVGAPTLQPLLIALERSARRDRDGERLPPLPPRPGQAGRFFPAHAAYLWRRNCNWWTVQRLREAGLASDPTGVGVAAQVPGRLRGFRAVAPQGKSSSPTVSVALHTRRIHGLSP